ncbi:hypothetical protein EDB80DRAFT_784280 [Ilyonectria destructans]|nr:hypothetical protein EDB80DRAFT_784280 [Ilyonectria destructans]
MASILLSVLLVLLPLPQPHPRIASQFSLHVPRIHPAPTPILLKSRDRPTLQYAPALIHDTGQVLQPLSELKLETDRRNEPQPKLEHTPDSVLGRAAEREADRDANPNPSSQSQTPRSNIIFSVNLPHDQNIRFCPKGTFQQMSLRNLVEQLHLVELLRLQPNFSRLKIILETPKETFEDNVTLYKEKEFEFLKARFLRKVAAILHTDPGFLFEICIQPIWVGGDDDEGSDGDDGECIIF